MPRNKLTNHRPAVLRLPGRAMWQARTVREPAWQCGARCKPSDGARTHYPDTVLFVSDQPQSWSPSSYSPVVLGAASSTVLAPNPPLDHTLTTIGSFLYQFDCSRPIRIARSGFGGPSPPSSQHVELWAHGPWAYGFGRKSPNNRCPPSLWST